MRAKTVIAILFAGFAVTFSNAAFSQTTNPGLSQFPIQAYLPRPLTHPTINTLPRKWVDESSKLPGIGINTLDIVTASVVVVAGVTILIMHGHKKHHKLNDNTALNTGLGPNLNPKFNIDYDDSPLNAGSNQNLDFNLVFSNNIKGVGIRYAFK